ncbi:MAG: hypothetical protein KDA79_09970, partial [Planctomycetaceae bacterium]|nr:hypothetical protein [Planctomycetaceae bacterium]
MSLRMIQMAAATTLLMLLAGCSGSTDTPEENNTADSRPGNSAPAAPVVPAGGAPAADPAPVDPAPAAPEDPVAG